MNEERTLYDKAVTIDRKYAGVADNDIRNVPIPIELIDRLEAIREKHRQFKAPMWAVISAILDDYAESHEKPQERMKETVEGLVVCDELTHGLKDIVMTIPDWLNVGDKVKLIIIKED